MARRRGQRDSDEGPSEADLERFGSATRDCPECGSELYDDVDLCWNCGHALSGRRPNGRAPAWVWIVSLAAAIALVLALVWL